MDEEVKTGEMTGLENEDITTIEEDYTQLESDTVKIDDDSDLQDEALYNQALEYKEALDEVKNEMKEILLAVLEKGEINANDTNAIEQLQEQYTESYTALQILAGENDIKVNTGDKDTSNIVINGDIDYDKLMDIISDKADWLYIDEDGQIMLNGEAVPKLKVMELEAEKIKADVGEFKDLTTENFTAVNAKIDNLEVGDLTAVNADITNLKALVAEIQTLVGGNLTMDNIQSLVLTSDKVTIADALIKDAMIETISANKINTGTINTNNVQIQSEDGSLLINGTTQQFKDNTGKVRIQIGKDAGGNFTFCLFSQDGVGILIDETGIKAGAVPDQLIVNDMISDGANISGGKLDISSVISSINNNENTLSSSKIKFDDTAQTLDVAFNQLKTKVETIENVTIDGDLSSVIEQVTTNTTNIGIMQGQISSLISNTTITKQDGTVVQLKDEFNSTKDTVNSHTQTINSLETNYDKVSGDISSVTAKQSQLEQNLDGFKATVSNTYSTKDELADAQNDLSQEISVVEQTANKINWVVGSGTEQSNMTLTKETYDLVSQNINLTADRINLNGYVSNEDSNWSITTEGNIEAKNLGVENELSTDILNVNTINNPKYPATLDGDINLYVNINSGDDDYTLDAVLASIDESETQGSADLIKKFATLRGAADALPLNLNGKTVRIYLETDDYGQVLFKNFNSGRILVFLCSHEVKGYIGDYNCYADFKIYGGSTQSAPSTYGVIRPSTNTVYNDSSDKCSVFFQKSPISGIYHCKVYGGDTSSDYMAIKVTEDCKCRIDSCDFYSAYAFVNASGLSEVYVNKTSGKASNYAFKSYTGSTIHLANTAQASGTTGNAYYSNANIIYGSLAQTISGSHGITWDGSSSVVQNTTTTPSTTTATATYKSTLGDTYRSTVYNNWKKDGTCRQGDWGYGDCTGVWFFGSQFAGLKDKTITKVTITITRQSNANGNNAAVEHRLYMHNHSTRPSGVPTLNSSWNTTFTLTRGQTRTITITDSAVLNAISNGTCKGFAIRHSYDSSHYSVCSGSATVKITYNE